MISVRQKRINVRKMAVIGIMSALSSVLMLLSFPVGLPNVSMDFSEVPALFTSFMYGPVSGVLVVLVKNLVNLAFSKTMGVGELSNFLIGASLVFVAGVIYSRKKTKRAVYIGILSGTFAMSAVSIFTNYFIIFPFFMEAFGINAEIVVTPYAKLFPFVDSLMSAILYVHTPFTFLKGLMVSVIVIFTYKRISPFIRGNKNYS